jgi:hypothetical protein
MTREDQVFIANVVVIDPTQGTMVLNVISWLIGVAAKFSIIVKIHKYRRLQEKHHFILMAVEVHDAHEHDMDPFIKECVHLFHDRWLWSYLSLSFYIQFFKQCVSIILQYFNLYYKEEDCIGKWCLF